MHGAVHRRDRVVQRRELAGAQLTARRELGGLYLEACERCGEFRDIPRRQRGHGLFAPIASTTPVRSPTLGFGAVTDRTSRPNGHRACRAWSMHVRAEAVSPSSTWQQASVSNVGGQAGRTLSTLSTLSASSALSRASRPSRESRCASASMLYQTKFCESHGLRRSRMSGEEVSVSVYRLLPQSDTGRPRVQWV